MLIEQLSDNSVKFTLTELELLEYGLDFNTISEYDNNTRAMVSNLILLAESQDNITVKFGTSEVYVEAFSCSDGNCIVYISLIPKSTPHKANELSNFLLCTTDNLNHLIRLSKQLVKFSLNDITSSMLYLKGDTFFLLLEFDRRHFEKVLFSVVEFCEYSTKRPTTQLLTEYWQPLAEYDAVYRLSLLK